MSAPMSDERLAEIRAGIPPEYPEFARLPETTADGDWVVKCGRVLIAVVPDYAVHIADFIADARQDVPALVAEVDRLRHLSPAWKHEGMLYDLTRDFSDHSGDEWRWLGTWDPDGSPLVVCLTDADVKDVTDPAEAINSMAGLIKCTHRELHHVWRPAKPATEATA